MLRLRRIGRKAAALFAAAFLASGTAGVSAVQAADVKAPAEEDFVLLQLQVKNYKLRNELRGYQTAGGLCVDLADVILALDLPIRIDKKSRRATGWLFSEDRTITIDRDKSTVQIVNNERALLPGELIDTPEGWCVDTDTLAGWLGARFEANLYESVLKLNSEESLPFIEAMERKSRAARLRPANTFDLARYPQAKLPYRAWRAPSVDAVAEVQFLDNEGAGAGEVRARYQLYANGELGGASVEARLASDSRGIPDSLRLRAFRKDPAGGMLGPLQATHVAVGDVESYSGNLAGGGGVGRGAFVSNRPLQRPTRFGTTVVRGALPLGWDAELYRNGQLLAFQSETADGRYEFEVPLIYGSNELEVVLYGPQGQIRRESQSIPIGYGALEPGKLEYWAGVVQRDRDLLSFHDPPDDGLAGGWQYAFGLQYGLDNSTVLGASGHSLFLDGRRRDYAELNLQRALGSLVFDVTAAQEIGRGRAYRLSALGRIGKVNLEAESFFLDGSFTSVLVRDRERSSHRLHLETVLGSGRRVVPVAIGVRRSTGRDGRTAHDFTARASLVLPRVSLTGVVNHRQLAGGRDRDGGTSVAVLANTRFLGLTLRAEAQYRLNGPQRGFDSARLTLQKRLDDRSELNFQLAHEAHSDITAFEAGYVRHFRRFALRAAGTADTRGGLGANLAISFSFGPDPFGGGLRFSHAKLAQRGQVAVSVFLDENGDGIRSPGEVPLEGIGLTAGQHGSSDPTDENGHAVVEDLNPYERVLISVDESTLPDPFLVPVRKGVVLTPRAGVAAELEIAVAPTGEVEGVIHGLEDTPRAGVELELVNASGEVAATALSEYDGFFLFQRVAYGTYRLRLAEASARALGTSRDLGRTVTLDSQRTLAALGVIRLRTSEIAALEPGSALGSSP